MAAEKGNQYWKIRTESGRNKIWSNPDELWKEALEYFESTQKRKWKKTDFRGSQVKKIEIPTETPFSITGLCLYLDCSVNTFKNYEKEKDFLTVTERIRNIIETQQFEGAVVGAFNSSIIASKLGLSNKVENTNKNYNYNSKELSKEEMKEYNESLENEY